MLLAMMMMMMMVLLLLFRRGRRVSGGIEVGTNDLLKGRHAERKESSSLLPLADLHARDGLVVVPDSFD